VGSLRRFEADEGLPCYWLPRALCPICAPPWTAQTPLCAQAVRAAMQHAGTRRLGLLGAVGRSFAAAAAAAADGPRRPPSLQ